MSCVARTTLIAVVCLVGAAAAQPRNGLQSQDLYKLQSVKNTSLSLTGASAGAQLTLQTALTDGSQDWELVQ